MAKKSEHQVIETDISSLISAVKKDISKDLKDNMQDFLDKKMEFLSTGNAAVNYAISGRMDGGFPCGWMTELAGLNSCVTGDTLVEIIVDMKQFATVLEVKKLLSEGKNVQINTPAGFQPVTDFVDKGLLPTFKVVTEGEEVIKVTATHKFFCSDGSTLVDPSNNKSKRGSWIETKDLQQGVTKILNSDGRWVTVVTVENIGEHEIFDLTVGHPCHCYFGNGLVNHNTGKSLLAQHALVETQKKGGVAILVDSEFAFNAAWFRTIGGNPETVIHYEPDYIEQAYQFIRETVASLRAKNSTIPITIVYDSIAASPSQYEFENEIAKHDMGKRAVAHGKGCRMLMGLTKKMGVTFISINQFRKTLCVSPQTTVSWVKE